MHPDDMRDNSTSRRAVGWVADSLNRPSQAIRNRDTSQLMNDISGFAKRNPALFLGGAALVGFAISRFAKASSTRSSQSYGGSQPWMGSDGDTGRSTKAACAPAAWAAKAACPARAECRASPLAGVGDENTAFGDSNFNQAGQCEQGSGPMSERSVDKGAPGLVADALAHVSNLVRSEVNLARAEVTENIKSAGIAIGMLAAALVIAITALNVLSAALVAAIAKHGHRCRMGRAHRWRGLCDYRLHARFEGHERPEDQQSRTHAHRKERPP